MKVIKTPNTSKVFMFDLDGTLLNDKGEISIDNLEAIQKAKAQNCYVTIATGRSLTSSLALIDKIGVDFFAITNNGAILYDVVKKEVINIGLTLNPIVKNLLFDFIINQKLPFLIYTKEQTYCYLFGLPNPFLKLPFDSVINLDNMSLAAIKDFILQQDIYNFNLYFGSLPFLYFERIFAKYQKEYQFCNFTTASKGYLDVYHFKTSKAYGLLKLLEYWEFNMNHLYYFGDSANDYEIMKYIKNTYTLTNGVESVQKIAKTILKGDNNSSVIACLIQEILCQNKT